jgi:hypothetical protein
MVCGKANSGCGGGGHSAIGVDTMGAAEGGAILGTEDGALDTYDELLSTGRGGGSNITSDSAAVSAGGDIRAMGANKGGGTLDILQCSWWRSREEGKLVLGATKTSSVLS